MAGTDIAYEAFLFEEIDRLDKQRTDAMRHGLGQDMYNRAVGYLEALEDVKRSAKENVHRRLFGDDPKQPAKGRTT